MWQKAFDYLRWPATLGLLAGLLILQLFPELNPRHTNRGEPVSTTVGENLLQSQSTTSYAEAVRRASPAVVNIYTRTQIQRPQHPLFNDPLFRYFFNNADISRQERMQSSLGSGVIVDPAGYLLTNNHVIHAADEIVVQLQDGRDATAQIVGVDYENDLAVLKIELDNLQSISLNPSHTPRVGDIVLAIGNPFGMGQTVTQGIISATGRHGLNINAFENFIQTDAAVNPGNSGGALIDVEGNLLGVNTAILDRIGNRDLDGVGLAIPADTAIRTLRDIVEFGRVVHGWLGVETTSLTPQTAQTFNLDSTNGIVITRIYNNGPAHQAGLQPGDVIVTINGEPVGDGKRGRQQIAESRPGDSVNIEFYRDGKREKVQAILQKSPVTG